MIMCIDSNLIRLTTLLLSFALLSGCYQEGAPIDNFIKSATDKAEKKQALQKKTKAAQNIKKTEPTTKLVDIAFGDDSPFTSDEKDRFKITRGDSLLEKYPVDQLSLVGNLKSNNEVMALIKTPTGRIIKAKINDPIGHNGGKIILISSNEIVIELPIRNKNQWTTTTSTLKAEKLLQK